VALKAAKSELFEVIMFSLNPVFDRIQADANLWDSTTYQHLLPGIDIAAINELLDEVQQNGGEVSDEIAAKYKKLEYHAGDCVGCGQCEDRCPFGVPIRDKMDEAQGVWVLTSRGHFRVSHEIYLRVSRVSTRIAHLRVSRVSARITRGFVAGCGNKNEQPSDFNYSKNELAYAILHYAFYILHLNKGRSHHSATPLINYE